MMQTCPRCGSESRQHKIGFTQAGSQRYKCQACECRYTPEPKRQGYRDEVRRQAVRMDLDGEPSGPFWPVTHYPMEDKSETYSVEGDNVDLRHYLARLARRSRCFSRCIHALRNAVKLFVSAFNRR